MQTLKVRELIELLQQQDPDNEVFADRHRQCLVVDIGYEGNGSTVYLHIAYPVHEPIEAIDGNNESITLRGMING